MTAVPLHPLLVHFPVAFYFLELVLLMFWRARREESWRQFADFSVGIGYLFMIVSMLTGYSDAGGNLGEIIRGPAAGHFYAALSVFLFYTGRGLYFKTAGEKARSHAAIRISVSFVGNVLVFSTAYLGGRLVYL